MKKMFVVVVLLFITSACSAQGKPTTKQKNESTELSQTQLSSTSKKETMPSITEQAPTTTPKEILGLWYQINDSSKHLEFTKTSINGAAYASISDYNGYYTFTMAATDTTLTARITQNHAHGTVLEVSSDTQENTPILYSKNKK